MSSTIRQGAVQSQPIRVTTQGSTPAAQTGPAPVELRPVFTPTQALAAAKLTGAQTGPVTAGGQVADPALAAGLKGMMLQARMGGASPRTTPEQTAQAQLGTLAKASAPLTSSASLPLTAEGRVPGSWSAAELVSAKTTQETFDATLKTLSPENRARVQTAIDQGLSLIQDRWPSIPADYAKAEYQTLFNDVIRGGSPEVFERTILIVGDAYGARGNGGAEYVANQFEEDKQLAVQKNYQELAAAGAAPAGVQLTPQGRVPGTWTPAQRYADRLSDAQFDALVAKLPPEDQQRVRAAMAECMSSLSNATLPPAYVKGYNQVKLANVIEQKLQNGASEGFDFSLREVAAGGNTNSAYPFDKTLNAGVNDKELGAAATARHVASAPQADFDASLNTLPAADKAKVQVTIASTVKTSVSVGVPADYAKAWLQSTVLASIKKGTSAPESATAAAKYLQTAYGIDSVLSNQINELLLGRTRTKLDAAEAARTAEEAAKERARAAAMYAANAAQTFERSKTL